jgi:chemotaxis protein MotB
MKKTACVFFWISILAMFCGGCVVAESKYLTKVNEADLLSKKVTALTEENASLKQQVESLTGQSNEQIKNIAGLQADIERLKESLSQAKKESQEVENKSKTYQELVKQMKSEIAQGQITIKELKGKLTMDVVDKILFASGEAKVKKEGLEVLNRVVEILKNVKDKNIRVEGHTDNVQITSKLAKKYPTNWELSAARALNVTRYLQDQGIDPAILSATAFGEYQPIADNETPEGRAKNRRIAIILLPKD